MSLEAATAAIETLDQIISERVALRQRVDAIRLKHCCGLGHAADLRCGKTVPRSFLVDAAGTRRVEHLNRDDPISRFNSSRLLKSQANPA